MEFSLESLLSSSCVLIDTVSHESEAFFNRTFDEGKWNTAAEQTNIYARSKIRTAGQGWMPLMLWYISVIHNMHNTWRDDNSTAFKIFIAHLIIMVLVLKLRIDHFWLSCNVIKTSLIGTYMSCNHFQNILGKLHLTENIRKPSPVCPGHDTFHQVRKQNEHYSRQFQVCVQTQLGSLSR